MSNEEKLQSLQRWHPALHTINNRPFIGMDASEHGEYVYYEDVAELLGPPCNSPEIEGIKPAVKRVAHISKKGIQVTEIPVGPPAPAAMSAEGYFNEHLDQCESQTGEKITFLWEEDARHAMDLRAQEAVRAFAGSISGKHRLFLNVHQDVLKQQAEDYINKHLKG